jgi:hypothetical protein
MQWENHAIDAIGLAARRRCCECDIIGRLRTRLGPRCPGWICRCVLVATSARTAAAALPTPNATKHQFLSTTGKLHPLWRKNLQNSLRENQTLPNCRFVQLSTLRINGTPASRTIVFRGFLEDPKGDPSSVLWFVGDLRTEKAEQVGIRQPRPIILLASSAPLVSSSASPSRR